MTMLGQGRAVPNDRRYEKDNGIVSAKIARAGGAATMVWGVGLAAINPVAGRTAGEDTTVYLVMFENYTGGTVNVWLENAGGAEITARIPVANNNTGFIDAPAGMNFGDMDLYVNADADGVLAQIFGTEA